MDPAQQEDLAAFEHRLMEIISFNKPKKSESCLLLGGILACAAVGACHFFKDAEESKHLVVRILCSQGAFALSMASLIPLLYFGFKIATAKTEIVRGTREVLKQFRLDCDDDGRLIHLSSHE
ncbi:hypothetical protein KR009_002295 [Drosophila setifemur]|nr:hypothetical protein KR009_002295 [Drosophila setifemur]